MDMSPWEGHPWSDDYGLDAMYNINTLTPIFQMVQSTRPIIKELKYGMAETVFLRHESTLRAWHVYIRAQVQYGYTCSEFKKGVKALIREFLTKDELR